MRKGILAMVAGWTVLAVCLLAPAGSSAATRCAPPRGPGDNLVHSEDLRAAGVGCGLARRVVLASTAGQSGRFSEGTPFNVGGYTWRCYASPFPGSHQRCTARYGKVVSIIWTD